MKRKTDFKELFLIDSSLYKRMNAALNKPCTHVSTPKIVNPFQESKSIDIKGKIAEENKISPSETENYEKVLSDPKNNQLFDVRDPIIKALKEDHEQTLESSEPLVKKAKYENNDNEVDFKEMIREIDEEIKNWNELRKDAIKMSIKPGGKRKQPRYIQYFTDKSAPLK